MQTTRLHSAMLVLLDALTVVVVFNLTGWLRGIVVLERLILTPLVGPFLFVLVGLYLIDGYRSRTEMMSADYTSQHMVAMVMALVATLLLTYVVIPEDFQLQGSRAVLAVAFIVIALISLGYRRSLHRWVKSERGERSVLFIGSRAACEEFRGVCATNGFNQRIICAVTGEATEPPIQITEIESSIRSYGDVIGDIKARRLGVEAIVIRESSSQLPQGLIEELTELYFRGNPTYTLELFFETYWRKIPLYRINHIWLFQEGFEIARNPVFERTKRVVDISVAALALLAATPVLLLAALLIKLEDGGPVLFRQTRIGRHREPFRIFKLRTMRSGSDASDENRYTQTDDPRITRIGSFLRKTRLDEVPQLWNVLHGEMSMIGPRAEWDRLVSDYEQAVPCYHFRHLVRPGITGWAQINYPYGANIDDTMRKLEYDLYYIRHFSFVMDAAIVLRTIHVMLFGKGK